MAQNVSAVCLGGVIVACIKSHFYEPWCTKLNTELLSVLLLMPTMIMMMITKMLFKHGRYRMYQWYRDSRK